MKSIFVGILLSVSLSSTALANATGFGSAALSLEAKGQKCENLAEKVSSSIEQLLEEAAKSSADIDCNETYPGTTAKWRQHIVSQKSECTKNRLILNLEAIYICDY